MDKQNSSSNSKSGILWAITGLLLIALLFARAVYPEYLWLTILVCVPLVISLGTLIHFNRKALRSRTTAYGVNSIVTVLLVIAIVGVLDFLTTRYSYKIDLTKNKIHTLSDQTVKAVKGISQPIKATLFAKIAQREQLKPLLENYKALNSKFDVEFVDPDREPTRAKEDGVKKYGTLHLAVGTREANVDEVTEEKVTNALIKLSRDKVPMFCAITGHGEHSLDSNEAEGYAAMKKAMLEQSYDTKSVNLLETGKIPADCDAIGILGPTKSFFPQEVKLIGDYLSQGGRAVIALDINLKGSEYSPELLTLLKQWYIQTSPAMIIDPISRQLGVDASVPILVTYSKDNAITRDFRGSCYFPFLRPLDVISGAPASLKVQWLAKTTPNALQITDMKQLATGKVAIDPSKTKAGPFTTAIAVEGTLPPIPGIKDSKPAPRPTRLVVFGTSNFANNNYSRFGGNSDLFLNSVAWVLEDNNMITIRAKQDGPGEIDMTQKEGVVIGLVTILLVPLLIATGGIVVWVRRRRL